MVPLADDIAPPIILSDDAPGPPSAEAHLPSSWHASAPGRHRQPLAGSWQGASGDAAGFLEGQARQLAEDAAGIAMAEVAEEVRLHRGAGEEGLVHLRLVEAGHGADIEPDRPRRQHEVGALQGAV